MRPRSAALCLAVVLAAAAVGGAEGRAAGEGPAARPPDVCDLLSEAEIRAVQGQSVAGRVPHDQPGRSFRVAQCVYRTPDVVSSVSLAASLPATAASGESGPRGYWRERFPPPQTAARGGPAATAGTRRKKDPPRAVSGLGEEAFWVGDRVAGALYVLQGNVFLRISVGGVPDEAARLERTKTLAASALKRLGP